VELFSAGQESKYGQLAYVRMRDISECKNRGTQKRGGFPGASLFLDFRFSQCTVFDSISFLRPTAKENNFPGALI
jgi:hypothetical protein